METEGIDVYILAGGGSTRFGADKARANVAGEPLLVHIARSMEPVARHITVVSDRRGKYRDIGFRTIADRTPGLGPMGGLERALADLVATGRGEWLLLASCDLLGLQREWIETLLARRGRGVDAVAFRGEVWQPLPALYHVGQLEKVRTSISRGRLALWRLLDEAHSASLPLPASWHQARQVNTRQDLEAVRAGTGEAHDRDTESR